MKHIEILIACAILMVLAAFALPALLQSPRTAGVRSKAARFVAGLRMAFAVPNLQQMIQAANDTVTIDDASLETHECTVRRSAEEALTSRYLIVKKGTADGQVLIAGSTSVPLGTVDNIVAIDEAVTVKLLGRGDTKKVVAAGAIGAGVKVYLAANGTVDASGTVYVGTSLTAALAAGDLLELNDSIESGDAPGVAASTWDANSVVIATTDDTPVALPFAASTIFARLASGNIVAATVAQICTLLGIRQAEVVSATNVIAASESGSTYFLNSATEFVSTLPAPAAGLRFRFWVSAAPSGASYTIVTNSSANIIHGSIASAEDAAGSVAVVAAADTITFVDGKAIKGDFVEVESDGTSWFITGTCAVQDGITSSQVS